MSRVDFRARLRVGPNLRSVRPRRIETTPSPHVRTCWPETFVDDICKRGDVSGNPRVRDDAPRFLARPERDARSGWSRPLAKRDALMGTPCLRRRARPFLGARGVQPRIGRMGVSLRAAQLLAGDSFTRRRSVAPLGASLAFGEIGRGRLRARPTERNRSTDWTLRPHAWPRKGSRVPTHPLSSCIAARARSSPP